MQRTTTGTSTEELELPASYLHAFSEEPGYLNFASYGPPSRDVVARSTQLLATAAAGAVGASELLHGDDVKARQAFARLSGFPLERVTLVPHTSGGLFQLAFGISGGSVLVSAGEFPANLYPWLRGRDIGRAAVQFMAGRGEPVTPEVVEAALTPATVAVTVSAVDFRTGFRADLQGIRNVIGPDRLLIVDGIQAFGVVDLDWSPADALVVGAQKWLRGGWGAGAMAFSQAGLERIRPVLSGWTGVDEPMNFDGVVHEPRADALRFSISSLSPFAVGAFASALDLVGSVTVRAIEAKVAAGVDFLIDRLDTAGVKVVSAREPTRRAGIVVAQIPEGRAAQAHAALAAAGLSTTLHGNDRIRLSVHATTASGPLSAAAKVLGEFS